MDLDTTSAECVSNSYTQNESSDRGGILGPIQNTRNKGLLLSGVFSHLHTVESYFFKNERCVEAIADAMSEISELEKLSPDTELPDDLEIPMDLVKSFISSKLP